jgi:hypothetical protein
MSVAKEMDSTICPTCGSVNECGVAKGEATCWCFTLPHVLPVSGKENLGRCYCRRCLTRLMGNRITGLALDLPTRRLWDG